MPLIGAADSRIRVVNGGALLNLPPDGPVAFDEVTRRQRAAVLLHQTPFQFARPYGIGDIGPEAYRFVDFLVFSRTETKGSVAAWTNRLWRFSLRVLLSICGQHASREVRNS